jgi:hypothetical protein
MITFEKDTFASYLETHYQIVCEIEKALNDPDTNALYPGLNLLSERAGMAENWALAQQLTTEFESIHAGRKWDGEWLEEVWAFAEEKLKALPV